MEDFNTGKSRFILLVWSPSHISLVEEGHDESRFPAEVIEEGTKLVEEILKDWSSQLSHQDGEDVVMEDGDVDENDPETELQALRSCFGKYQPRIESNPWVQHLIASLG